MIRYLTLYNSSIRESTIFRRPLSRRGIYIDGTSSIDDNRQLSVDSRIKNPGIFIKRTFRV